MLKSLKSIRAVGAAVLLAGLVGIGAAQGRPDVKWETGLDSNPTCVALIKNQAAIAVGGYTGTVKIMNFWTWTVSQSIRAFTLVLESIAVSPDGSTLVAEGEDSQENVLIRAYSMTSGKLMWQQPAGLSIGYLSFSPDGTRLLVNGADSAQLILAGNGQTIASVNGTGCFSPDGSVFWTAYGDNITQYLNKWSSSNGQMLAMHTYTSTTGPNGYSTIGGTSVLAESSLGWLALWDYVDDRVNYIRGDFSYAGSSVPSNTGTPLAGCFTSAGTGFYLAFWAGGNVETDFCDAPGGCPTIYLSIFTYHSLQSPACLAFAPNDPGLFVAGNLGGPAALEEVALEPTNLPLQQGQDYQLTVGREAITCTAWSPNGTLVASGGLDGTVDLSSTADGSVPYSFSVGGKVTGLAFTPDGQSLVTASGPGWDPGSGAPGTGQIQVWNVASQKPALTIPFDANAVAVSPDGTMLAAGDQYSVVLYNLSTGAKIKQLSNPGEQLPTMEVAFSPDGSQVAAGGGLGYNSSGYLRVWNLTSGNELGPIPLDAVTAISFSPDGSEVAVARGNPATPDQQAQVISIATGQTVLSVNASAYAVTSVAISPDGETLMTGGNDYTVRAYSIKTGQQLAVSTQSTDGGNGNFETGALGMSFSPDGTLFSYGTGTASVVVARNDFWVAPTIVKSLSLSASSVTSGTSVTATLTLAKVPLGSTSVPITYAGPVFGPASVTVSAGQPSAIFTVNTQIVTSETTAKVSASLGTGTASAEVAVRAPDLISVTRTPASIIAGGAGTGTATLLGPAPAGGVSVSLASNAACVGVPASVTVLTGATSASFAISTFGVSSNTVATISAALGGVTRTTTVTVEPPNLTLVSLNPSSVRWGASSTGTVSIATAAATGGQMVALSSDSTFATAPPSVTIAAGAKSATFTVSTSGVTSPRVATISASLGILTKAAKLTVNPPALGAVDINGSVVGGSNGSGTVVLASAAPPGGISVALSSGSSSAIVPATVTVAAGSASAPFTIKSVPVAVTTGVTITAALNGLTKSAILTVKPPEVLSFTRTPASLVGGGSATGTVTLATPAPAGGLVVSLGSNAACAIVPATVTVPGGATSVSFTISTTSVTATVVAMLSATSNGVTRTTTLTVEK